MMGYTINMIVLFSLILAVGMLVDDAIIVTEFAERRMSEGMPKQEAFARDILDFDLFLAMQDSGFHGGTLADALRRIQCNYVRFRLIKEKPKCVQEWGGDGLVPAACQ